MTLGYDPTIGMLDLRDTVIECVAGRRTLTDADEKNARALLDWTIEVKDEVAELKLQIAGLRLELARATAGDARPARAGRSSSPSQKRSSTHRPPPSSTSQMAFVHPSSRRSSSAVDEQVDERDPRSSSASDLQDHETATEGEDRDLPLDPISRAAEARAREGGRSSTAAETRVDERGFSAVDEELDEQVDEDTARGVDEDADSKLKWSMAGAWDGLGGAATSGAYRARMATAIPMVRKVAAEQGKTPETVWAEAVARFKADPETRRKRLGLPVLIAQFEQWTYDPEPKPPSGGGSNGNAAPAPAYTNPFPRLEDAP